MRKPDAADLMMAPVGLMVFIAVLYGTGAAAVELTVGAPTMACQDCFDIMVNKLERYERGESIESIERNLAAVD